MPEKGDFASVANDPGQEESYPGIGNSVVQNKTRRVIARNKNTIIIAQPIANRLASPLLAQCSEWVMASLPGGNG